MRRVSLFVVILFAAVAAMASTLIPLTVARSEGVKELHVIESSDYQVCGKYFLTAQRNRRTGEWSGPRLGYEDEFTTIGSGATKAQYQSFPPSAFRKFVFIQDEGARPPRVEVLRGGWEPFPNVMILIRISEEDLNRARPCLKATMQQALP